MGVNLVSAVRAPPMSSRAGRGDILFYCVEDFNDQELWPLVCLVLVSPSVT